LQKLFWTFGPKVNNSVLKPLFILKYFLGGPFASRVALGALALAVVALTSVPLSDGFTALQPSKLFALAFIRSQKRAGARASSGQELTSQMSWTVSMR